MSLMGKPEDNTRSSVCPNICVGPDTDCLRLKESISYTKYFTRGFEGQHRRILKSPTIKRLSLLVTISDKNSEKSLKKSLLEFGGLYITAMSREHEDSTSEKSVCTLGKL